MSVSEAFEVVLLDEKTLDEIEEPVKDFEILDLNAANANDSGNSGKNAIGQAHDMFSLVLQDANMYTNFSTAKRKLERLQFSTSSSFVKIWSACSCEFKARFWIFRALYHLLFDLETIGVN